MKSEFSQYQSTYWAVNYPFDWIVEKHSECTSFYAQDGVGALQVSAYLKDKEVTQKDLMEFIRGEVPKDENLRKAELSGYVGLETDYKYVDHYWRMWFLMRKNIMLYVTYNCEFDDRNTERDTINQMVESLK